jgi:hypothetical protein
MLLRELIGRAALSLATGVTLVCCAGCGGAAQTNALRAATPYVLAAGDIVGCEVGEDEATAEILARNPQGVILTLGDNAYEDGTIHEFSDCFDSSWGRFKGRIHPALGDHDYRTERAAGYFRYFGRLLERFGPAAVDPERGWYSFNVLDWHVVVLNSNCARVSGCFEGSPQQRWLERDLNDNRSVCTLAVWHYPLFSSGLEGPSESVRPLWDTLYASGADVVLNGHNHAYERFDPLDPTGKPDPRHGIREFVVGTGGRSHYPFASGEVQPNSVVRNDTTFGVLKLVLYPNRYSWTFLPITGEGFTDAGRANCH